FHRRDLRTHSLSARRSRDRAYLDGPNPWDARSHGDRQFDVENVLGHRLARWLLYRKPRDNERDSESPRLPDRGSSRAIAIRGRVRSVFAAGLLRSIAG